MDGLGAGIGVRHVGPSEYRDTNTLLPYNGFGRTLTATLTYAF